MFDFLPLSIQQWILSILSSLFMFAGFMPPVTMNRPVADKVLEQKRKTFEPVVQRLVKQGVSQKFIDEMLAHSDTKFEESLVKINVSLRPAGNKKGYRSRSSAYDHVYTANSIKSTKDFIIEQKVLLEEASKKYNVPAEVIASILWVETRFGKYTGNNHVPSVYLSVAMASEDKYLEENKKDLRATHKKKSTLQVLYKKLEERSQKKADWAIEQLVALEKMQKTFPSNVLELKGSWAGAFGLSQFLPASYLSWAVDGDKDGKINLYNFADAIHSVANYLKTNGWGETEEEKYNAVFHYNNSSAYVDAVLTLSEEAVK
ncbi:MAG: lytic murein transglycosylase [Candidatus Kapabacteria bacterium]|nr:lytic murein transglycosylase [Candidatus Kapabacteria bacterium]